MTREPSEPFRYPTEAEEAEPPRRRDGEALLRLVEMVEWAAAPISRTADGTTWDRMQGAIAATTRLAIIATQLRAASWNGATLGEIAAAAGVSLRTAKAAKSKLESLHGVKLRFSRASRPKSSRQACKLAPPRQG